MEAEQVSKQDTIEYLVNRFADNLSKFDVQNLFETLRTNKGSIAAASKEIDIERKTVYDWESNDSEVKLATKKKILLACLNEDIAKTVAYLMEKNMLDYYDISERYCNFVFEKIMASENRLELQSLTDLFKDGLKHNRLLLQGATEEKIQEMIKMINQKAEEYQISLINQDLSLISSEKLAQKFLLLIDILSENKLPKQEIATALQLPESFVARACEVYGYLYSGEMLNMKSKPRLISEKLDKPDQLVLPSNYQLSYRKSPTTIGYIATREY